MKQYYGPHWKLLKYKIVERLLTVSRTVISLCIRTLKIPELIKAMTFTQIQFSWRVLKVMIHLL